jgi:hypothetical protein
MQSTKTVDAHINTNRRDITEVRNGVEYNDLLSRLVVSKFCYSMHPYPAGLVMCYKFHCKECLTFWCKC